MVPAVKEVRVVATPDVLLAIREVVVVVIDLVEELTVLFILVLLLIVVELQWVYVLFAFACWFFCIVSRVYMLKGQGYANAISRMGLTKT